MSARKQTFAIVAALILAATGASRAESVCGEWTPGVSPVPGTMPRGVHALANYDDGSGRALFVGGEFLYCGTVLANFIAKWDGGAFSPLGAGVGGYVLALAEFDDGGGSALYAGGYFTSAGETTARRIAKWNGHEWSSLGDANGIVRALTVFDDGGGPALFAGGDFTVIGGVDARSLARWNGSSWAPVAGGIASGVLALLGFDDGFGPALYVAGSFTATSEGPANRIARVVAGHWQNVGVGMDGPIRTLAVFDDGPGSALYAGGSFVFADYQSANGIARWNGFAWSPVGSPAFRPSMTDALGTFDDGNGTALYAGGVAVNGDPTSFSIAKWDGASWSGIVRLGAGVVDAFVTFDDGVRPVLVAGGLFAGVALAYSQLNIGKWDGTSWSALVGGFDNVIHAMRVFDDGTGPALYAGGYFLTAADGTPAARVARFDGTRWLALGAGLDEGVEAFAVFDDGNGAGPMLYAGGRFRSSGGVALNYVARWNGTTWSALGVGMSDAVHALRVFDDGTGRALYAGGTFTSAGGAPANYVARWNGSSWSPVGTGTGGAVVALNAFDGGGHALYAGGGFATAGGATVNNIARWNGSAWSEVGGGVTGFPQYVNDLLTFDDGSGTALYVAGNFGMAGGLSIRHIAKWNGATWSAVGTGLEFEVAALTTFDDGSGRALYTGGGSYAERQIMVNRWNGTSWATLGRGLSHTIYTLAGFDDGSGPALFAGGSFGSAGGIPSFFFARWSPSVVAGNVGIGAGGPHDVLFVNGSRGDSNGNVVVGVGQPIAVRLDAPLTGPASASYCLWLWHGLMPHSKDAVSGGVRIGCAAHPTPLALSSTPQPFRCHLGGLDPDFGSGVPLLRMTPSSAPWTLVRNAGVARPVDLTVQAVLADNGAANTLHLSVSNAVFLRIR